MTLKYAHLNSFMKSKQPESWIWWKHGVIYHIYPRSFMDANGDGVGDLLGIIDKLDYLAGLGIDAIWLSPVYLSPMVDFGYDVADYREIDPIYGSINEFKALITKAHDLDIRIISDMILNHTSDQHPWFRESSSSIDNPKRDWYIWKDGDKDGPPNNWSAMSGGSAWQVDALTGQYYFHSFYKEQPDLNWRNSELSAAFFEEIKFWLELGVDGFRLDVINLIIKDDQFRDNPYFLGIPLFQKHLYTRNQPYSHHVIRELRKLIDQYPERLLVGEIYTLPPGDSKLVSRYLDHGEGLHMAFDFSLIFSNWNAYSYYKRLTRWYRHIPTDSWPCNVFSNHDLLRNINRIPWRMYQEEKAKVTAALLLTIKGTPFIYYGEEIGMRNTRINYKQIHDPFGKRYWPFFSGRDKARTPMQWNSCVNAGFTKGVPWLPVNDDAKIRNLENQAKEPTSLFSLYQKLIHIRCEHIALQQGNWTPILNGQNGILSYSRGHSHETIIVILNFTRFFKHIRLREHTCGYVLASTHRDPDELYYFQHLQIYPFEASIFIAGGHADIEYPNIN
jgi:alpha-glucosidase